MALGQGAITLSSTLQWINIITSTESILVLTDNIILRDLAKGSLKVKGTIIKNSLNQNSQSTMKLEQNGKASSGNQTFHFSIKFFYITNLTQCQEHL